MNCPRGNCCCAIHYYEKKNNNNLIVRGRFTAIRELKSNIIQTLPRMHIQRRHLHLPFADHHRQIQALREMKSVVASSHPPPTHLFIRQQGEEEEEEYPRAQHFPFATLVNFYKEISTFFCSTHPISQSLSCTTIHSTTDIHTRSRIL